MSNRAKKNTKPENVEADSEDNAMQMKDNKATKQTGGAKNSKAKAGSKSAAKTISKAGSKSSKSGSKSAKTVKAKKNEDSERYFKLVDAKTGKSHGRYVGDTPKQAASKGYTKMLRKLKAANKKPPAVSMIYLRESTRGSARKIYGYEASRLELDEPQERTVTDKDTGEEKTIINKFRNRIKKAAVPEQIGGVSLRSKSNKKSGSKSSGKSTRAGSKNAKKATPAKKSNNKPSKAGSKKAASGKSKTQKKSAGPKASSSR